MAGTPTDILSKLNVGSGLNTADIVSSLVDAERLPALENIERNEAQAENRISAYAQLKSEIKDFRTVVRSISNSNSVVMLILQVTQLLLPLLLVEVLVKKILTLH